MTGFANLDVFLENFRRGGGSFPIQKITLQIFLVSKRYILVVNFGKNVQKGGRGGVISNPKNFIANLRKLAHIYELSQKKAQCNFQKVTGEGGGSRPFGDFTKKTSIFGARDVPYLQFVVKLILSQNMRCFFFSNHR